MKVAFIGSHGVGRTTLCYDLASRLKRQDRAVDLVKEVARRCPLPVNRDTTLSAQAWILHTQIADQVAGAPDRLAAQLADRYRIERELGAGGMARVNLAHDLKHDRDARHLPGPS